MKDYTGTIVYFDQEKFDTTVNWYKQIIIAVDQVGKAYNDLFEKKLFSQAVYDDILANKTKNVSARYIEFVSKQTKDFAKVLTTAIQENAQKNLEEFQKVVEKMFDAKQRIISRMPFFSVPVFLQMVAILDGKAELKTGELKKLFEYKIVTERDNMLYNSFLQFKAAYDKLIEGLRITDGKVNDNYSQFFGEMFFENDKQLVLNHEWLSVEQSTCNY